MPEKLEGKKVAVVAGTAHEAYLKALFTEVELRAYPTADAARLALRSGDVDLLFGDAISLAFWLNGTDSENCCGFRGGPYLDSRYFGEGIGIAVRRGNDTLRQALIGRCSGSGSRAASPICGCAIFRSARFEASPGALHSLTPRPFYRARESEPMTTAEIQRRRAARARRNTRTPGRSRRRASSSRG